MKRLQFLEYCGIAAASVSVPGLWTSAFSELVDEELFFDISLAEWSLHRALQSGELDHLDFPTVAKQEYGINAVEYVNQFFADKAEDRAYLDELNTRCSDLGVDQLLIMVDGEGALAVSDDQERLKAVENHHKWVKAAKHLGCHSIRVNTYGDGTREVQKEAAVDSLGRLSEFAKDYGINIIVENHGGYSSDGRWLADVMQQVDMENCGTLPDFGNFCIRSEKGSCVEEYNRYKGVRQMMPFAKGVSAKSYAFNDEGQETTIDYHRMLKIISDAGYTGHIGIEYEGDGIGEYDGIKATKALLVAARQEISK